MLTRWCGISRLAYNTCLMKWDADYRDSVAKHNYYSIKKWFNSIKYERFPFIAECSKWVPEAAIKDLQTGFTNLFRHRGNHPKLHRKGRNDSFRIDGSVVRIDGKTVRLPKRLTVRMMERIPNEGRITEINNVTVSELLNCESIASLEFSRIVELKLLKVLLNRNAGLAEVTFFGLVCTFFLLVLKSDLNGCVTINLFGLLLYYRTRTCLNNGNRNENSVLSEDLCHANLFT